MSNLLIVKSKSYSLIALQILTVILLSNAAIAQTGPGQSVMVSSAKATQNVLSEAAQQLAEADYNDYKSVGKYASGKWNDLVKNGISSFHAENYEIAYQNLFKAFNAGCESPIVLFMLALISEYNESYYSAIEMYQLARKGFDVANQNHRYNGMFYENYGRALYYSGRAEQARPILTKAAKKTKSFWLLKLMGMLAYDKGDTLNAVAYFERAVRIKSEDVTNKELVEIYTTLGRLFASQNEPDGAKRYYYQTLQIDPQNAEANQYLRGTEKSNSNAAMQEQLKKMLDE